MSKKIRIHVTPSSLGSYFGVGFLSPEEQYKIDIGDEVQEFDDESMLRMELGNHLEDAAINYFQDVIFKVPITDRNTEVKVTEDDKVRYKLDGIIHFDEPAVFENKISNAVSGKFTDNMGYIIQLQTYMMYEGLNKGVLAGLYQGKPIYKIFDKDEELQADIAEMIDFIDNALSGFVDFYDDYPVHLLDKYGKVKLYEPITNLSSITINYLHELAELKHEESIIKNKIRALERAHENDFEIEAGVYEDDRVIVRVSQVNRSGGFDIDLFKELNPYMDLSSYMKPDYSYTMKRIKIKDPN